MQSLNVPVLIIHTKIATECLQEQMDEQADHYILTIYCASKKGKGEKKRHTQKS